jgi:hypothetical protein
MAWCAGWHAQEASSSGTGSPDALSLACRLDLYAGTPPAAQPCLPGMLPASRRHSSCPPLRGCLKHLTSACRTLLVNCVEGITANHGLLSRRIAESVTLVTALNPLIGYEKAALIAKAAIASGKTIAVTAEELGIMTQADMQSLLVAEKLTQAGALSIH